METITGIGITTWARVFISLRFEFLQHRFFQRGSCFSWFSFLQEVAHGRKVLELQGDIRKDACSQTDHCKEIVVEQSPRTSQCAPELAQFVPPASTLAQAHPIKVPAFQMLSQDKATDVLGPPKWKRQLMAKARVWKYMCHISAFYYWTKIQMNLALNTQNSLSKL